MPENNEAPAEPKNLPRENPYLSTLVEKIKERCQKNAKGWGQTDSVDMVLTLIEEHVGELSEEDSGDLRECVNLLVNPSAARQLFEKKSWLEKVPDTGKKKGILDTFK